MDEGNYEVTLDGKTAKISIKFERNFGGMTNVMGWEVSAPGSSKIIMTPDHHGLINKTIVIIEIPYYILAVKRYLIMPDGQKIGPHEDHFGEVSRECIRYLNKLIEVVKVKTGKYWIESLSSRDVFINNFDLLDDNNAVVDGALAVMPCGGGFGFLNNITEQNNVQREILDVLKNEKDIPRYELLYLDALNYFSTGRFNESVILINSALEVFVAQYLYNKLIKTGTVDEIDKKVRNYFKDGLHKVMKKALLEVDNRSLENNKDLWDKFEYSRNKRTNAIHSRSRNLTEKEARMTMNNILQIINWLLGESKYPLDVE